MKPAGAIIFLFCFLMMTFSKSFTLFNFYLNQDAITAKFCVNKNKPKMNCNGKCYLAKQIKEQEKREAGNAIMELVKIEVVSSHDFFVHALTPKYATLKLLKSVYQTRYSDTPFSSEIFRPPSC